MIRSATSMLVAALLLVPSFAGGQSSQGTAKDSAKPPANAPALVSSAPERTTASFGDWVLRCEGSSVTPGQRFCEVAHAITLQGQSTPIAQVALGRQTSSDPKSLTVVLPTNVAFAAKPQVTIAKPGVPPIELVWRRCAPGGCFASTQVNDEVISMLVGQTEPGKLLFKDAADREIALPLSFRGLAQSLAALAKEQ